jgi:hypothetical protein
LTFNLKGIFLSSHSDKFHDTQHVYEVTNIYQFFDKYLVKYCLRG